MYANGVNVDVLVTMAIMISYHGYNDKSVTLHSAVSSKSDASKMLLNNANDMHCWIDFLKQVAIGLDYLHTNYKIIHNDIKSDNVCLTTTLTTYTILMCWLTISTDSPGYLLVSDSEVVSYYYTQAAQLEIPGAVAIVQSVAIVPGL